MSARWCTMPSLKVRQYCSLRAAPDRRLASGRHTALSTAMGFGVFIHRYDSIYDDSPAERYQFPRQYLGRVQACVGDWIVYYEPVKVDETRGYFAMAKVGQ